MQSINDHKKPLCKCIDFSGGADYTKNMKAQDITKDNESVTTCSVCDKPMWANGHGMHADCARAKAKAELKEFGKTRNAAKMYAPISKGHFYREAAGPETEIILGRKSSREKRFLRYCAKKEN